ncbi:MAG: RagB/SusD family nutrient uptake outer membrane protein [Alphaproteobacteria bacterium]|nr:RagB/SusD family nutrient uptake outer membrane protein [Alphaproteobacteria bacterium]
MKKNKIFIHIAVSILLVAAVSCQDFLDEVSVSDITTDSYVTTETGYEDLVKANYPLLRDMIRSWDLTLNGTDIFTNGNWNNPVTQDGNAFQMYDVRLNSSMGELINLWDILYRNIGRANTAIARAENVTYANPALKAARVGEVKFLRALSYFYLVQTWGDVPMPLGETVSAETGSVRVPQAEIYAQILKDLLEAETDLPVTATNYGRATKGAAQFLLAKVYLTRGWNFQNALGGSPADFNSALSWADKVIAAYPLVAEYKNLFPQHNKNPHFQYSGPQNAKNSEVVFAVQFSDQFITNTNETGGEGGNHYHSIFGGSVGSIPGNLGRTNDYNRQLERTLTAPATYRLFDPQNDSRYQHNFVKALYALQDANNISYSFDDPSLRVNYAKGDTVVLFRPWNDPAPLAEKGIDVGGTKKYAVINVDEYGAPPTSRLNGLTPLMWKFWQPGIQYGDGWGTFDYALFRSAEAYLLAAEAIVKGATGGALGGADVYYNRVLDRAVGVGVDPMRAQFPENVQSLEAVSYRATPTNIDVDMILDESARELMGEFNRWFDLKRTGKLIERTKRMNPWTSKPQAGLAEHHLVRPIPQHEIDRSQPSIPQNPGY